jgi:hypothetical protein
MTNEQCDAIMRASEEALRPLETPPPDAEPRVSHGLPRRSNREMDAYRADAEAAIAARKRADEELRRESRRDVERSRDWESWVIELVESKTAAVGSLVAELGEGATAFADAIGDAVTDLRGQVVELKTALEKSRTTAADQRVELVNLRAQVEALRSAMQVEIRAALTDGKAEMLARIDALSLLLHKAVGDAAALRTVEDNLGRRLDSFKLVN